MDSKTKEILQNISSVKNSIDYEKKNIKVNTFRFSLYNYYDRFNRKKQGQKAQITLDK